jgi:diguanylate cyclase (GGDEF)-like protein
MQPANASPTASRAASIAAPSGQRGVAPKAGVDQARYLKIRDHSIRNHRLAAWSYLLDGLFLALFWAAGTVGWEPFVAYTLTGLALSGLWMGVFAVGATRRLKDPTANVPVVLLSSAVQLGAMALVPELAFMFALILFIIYIAFTTRISPGAATVMWLCVSAAVGLVLLTSGQRMRIPSSTLAEQALAWAFLALTLWRCLLLGSHNHSMMTLLDQRSLELAELTSRAERLANHDELTGLLNRRSLLDALRNEQAKTGRSGAALSVAMIDIDRFKSVNDTLGHQAGDKALKAFGAALQHLTRRNDHVGRYGGEEFLMVLVDTSTSDAHQPIERLRRALLAAEWTEVAPGFTLTFSCGIAACRAGEIPEELIKRADDALHRAKTEGRNCTRLG